MMKYSLGFDIGSSSVKVALYNASNNKVVDVIKYPDIEMKINSPHPDWAEQNPETWWNNLCVATRSILHKTKISKDDIISIGIAYQMHGLVIIDKHHQVLRPCMIWCDSRAVDVGSKAFNEIGKEHCLQHMLNSPGNFTASKLKWVQENEPEIYHKIYKFMLPGDYINMQLTGEINTTISGLSEGILWDFLQNKPSDLLLHHYGISNDLIPDIKPSFSLFGKLTPSAAASLHLVSGIKVTYKAGDQPNNALALNVMQPGEIAASAGTSGVIYAISDQLIYDENARVNSFAHVNHSNFDTRIGTLLCINGAGSQYAWIKQQVAAEGLSYQDMETLASAIAVGSDGLRVMPFGNGSERMLGDTTLGAQIINIHFNRHSKSHLYRAALEGVAFSFVYGCEILMSLGIDLSVIKAGNDNLFQSGVFSSTISRLLNCEIDIYDTTGAIGAAKASLIEVGLYSMEEMKDNSCLIKSYSPDQDKEIYINAYGQWKNDLFKLL